MHEGVIKKKSRQTSNKSSFLEAKLNWGITDIYKLRIALIVFLFKFLVSIVSFALCAFVEQSVCILTRPSTKLQYVIATFACGNACRLHAVPRCTACAYL